MHIFYQYIKIIAKLLPSNITHIIFKHQVIICISWVGAKNCLQGGPKKVPYVVFHSKVLFYNFFPYIFRWCRQQAWQILLITIWIQLDNLLCSSRQNSVRHTLPQIQFFWHSRNAGEILPPQDLNFARKELNVIMEDLQNWCSWNNSFLWETTCWFSGRFLKVFL